MTLPEGVSVPYYTRLQQPGATNHVFVVERNGTPYTFRVDTGSGLSYAHKATGSSARAVMQLEVQNILNDASGYEAGAEIEVKRLDADGERAVSVLFSSMFGVDWSKYEGAEETDAEAEELKGFHELLKRQVSEWKGGRINFAIARHSYWPTFLKMFHKAAAAKHGPQLKLYRGVYGQFAGDILRGSSLPIRKLTAWSLDINEALHIAHYGAGGDGSGGYRKDYWLVVQVAYPVADAVAAPVTIPDYKPDPKIYHAFNHEDEVVIVDKRKQLPQSFFKIVRKSRKKLSMAERVALRYMARSV